MQENSNIVHLAYSKPITKIKVDKQALEQHKYTAHFYLDNLFESAKKSNDIEAVSNTLFSLWMILISARNAIEEEAGRAIPNE